MTKSNPSFFDVIVIGAGAAGLMCAIEAGKRGRTVLVLDHANKVGKKILMSGGGRCNFTNISTSPENYISHNKHFCRSALSRYTPADFIKLVKQYQIPYHEKTLGQLFCDNKSSEIVNMLLKECQKAGVTIKLNTTVRQLQQNGDQGFLVKTEQANYQCISLVIATGGLSIPTMGATPFGYKIAEQFGLKVWPTQAGLVPFTLHSSDKEKFSPLSGISVNSVVSNQQKAFSENLLFTHRGLSGPAILQISSYWTPGETVTIDFVPNTSLINAFKAAKAKEPNKLLKTWLTEYLPKRVVETLLPENHLSSTVQSLCHKEAEEILNSLSCYPIKPNGTEGYRTAEVTLGGVDCDELSSKTMESRKVPGLYFIGEVVDVTGWLGGYNFQWAWCSGWAAGQVV